MTAEGPARPRRRWPGLVLLGVMLLLAVAAAVFWDDLKRNALDPQQPYQVYTPPPAPDYRQRSAWALIPASPQAPSAADPPADVFFIGPTTYAGGRNWNGPVDDVKSGRLFRRVVAPNYAGPFLRVGRIFAPRYRQASLYSLLTLREDAREARRFAYGDVARAFRAYLEGYNTGRPFVLVGVEQGGTLAARLLAEEIAPHPDLRGRLAAAYLIDTVVPADATPIPPCTTKAQAGCLAAWMQAAHTDLDAHDRLLNRALVWNAAGDLVSLAHRPALCFNPILGAVTDQVAPARLNLGAANATGLEWGDRPAFMARQVSANCSHGLLRITRPRSSSLRPSGGWTARRMEPDYNLFYADLESDAKARVAAVASQQSPSQR